MGTVATLCARLRADAGGGAVARGVDFPLGLPRGSVTQCGVEGEFAGVVGRETVDPERRVSALGATEDGESRLCADGR